MREHPDLIVGVEKADDAGVFRLSDEQALVQTVDFFTPIVDDPELFGRIAAANALSDVYAMGGRPLCAMNVVGFPAGKLDMGLLRATLAGGLSKMREADVVLVGGHSLDNPEFFYGLSVSGLVHPDRVLTNCGARDGDALVLTKPLGTGIVTTAIKAGKASQAAAGRVGASMEALNRKAADLLTGFEVHACTDVTGFGLVGHGAEMIEDSDVCLVIESASLPVFEEALEYADMGLLPGGLHRNRKYRKEMLDIEPGVPRALQDLVCDPQTSGGLLIALPAGQAAELVDRLHADGVESATVIGMVRADRPGRIVVT